MSLGHCDPTIGVLFIDFFSLFIYVILYIKNSILNLSLSSHDGMITSDYPVLNFFACMCSCTKAENTFIFFPMIRETKVRAPQKSNFSKVNA